MRDPRDKPLCSVIIRSFNEERHIGRLLTGILQQSIREVEIILVDSGSTDATVSIASRFPVKIVTIKPEAFTFGRSLNLGCEQARGEFLVVASAHVYPVYIDWLENLLRPFEDPQVAVVYGKQRGGKSTKFSEHQIFAKWFPDASVARQDHPFCNNANAAVRRALWQQRPYDESLPGLEDLDWATWALSQGYFLAYSAEAEVVHVHNETARQVYNRYRREAMALKHIHPGENFHFWDFLRLYTLNVASDCWYAFRNGKMPGALASILGFRFMQFWGTYRGFRISGPITSELKRSFYYPRSIRKTGDANPRGASPVKYGGAGDGRVQQEDLA